MFASSQHLAFGQPDRNPALSKTEVAGGDVRSETAPVLLLLSHPVAIIQAEKAARDY